MLRQCTSCNENVGYFKLSDTLCNACISDIKPKKSKISRIFSFSKGWGFVFIAGFVAHIFILKNNPISDQFALSISLIFLAFLSFIFSFVARFYLFRRELHLALAIVISLPFGFTILAIAGFTSTSPVTITTLGFIFFPFYILRLPNILQGLYMATAKANR